MNVNKKMVNSNINIAIISLVLYLSLFLVCSYQYLSFKNGARRGRYDDPKMSFFLILAASAALDIPLYVGCISLNGPFECEWSGDWFNIFWILHVIATLGYTVSLCIPAILWYDVIVLQDGRIFSSENRPSCLKLILRFIIGLYVIVTIVNVIGVLLTMKSNDQSSFEDINNPFFALLYFSDTFLSLAITMVILFSGVSLQVHVTKRLTENCMSSILFSLNFVMLFIVLSYTLRAIFVINLYLAFDQYQFIPIKAVSYHLWLIVTAWVPHVFCSFALLIVMIKKYDLKSYNNNRAEHRIIDYLFGCFPCLCSKKDESNHKDYEANVSSNYVTLGDGENDDDDGSNYNLKISPERIRGTEPLLRLGRSKCGADDTDQYSLNFKNPANLATLQGIGHHGNYRLSISDQSSILLYPAISLDGGDNIHSPINRQENHSLASSNENHAGVVIGGTPTSINSTERNQRFMTNIGSTTEVSLL